MPEPAFVVRAPIASMHAEARVSSPQVSQRLAGHVVRVTERSGDWLHVRGDDDYAGWMHGGAVVALDDRLREALGRARVSLGCVVRDARTGARRPLPLGALVLPDEVMIDGEALARDALRSHFPAEGAAIARSAASWFSGTSYQWGGVTPWGADCSGLVQTVFELHGVALPRDAWQQATCGTEREAAPWGHETGALLFFSERADGRVTHVGVSAGDGRMVHSALGRGGQAIERLDDPGDAYIAALVGRYVGARVVL